MFSLVRPLGLHAESPIGIESRARLGEFVIESAFPCAQKRRASGIGVRRLLWFCILILLPACAVADIRPGVRRALEQGNVSHAQLAVAQGQVQRGQIAAQRHMRVAALNGDGRAYLVSGDVGADLDGPETIGSQSHIHFRLCQRSCQTIC